MDYDPLGEKPQIKFDVVEWGILILCVLAVLYVAAQIIRAM